jgi:hypothetical protein
VEQRREHGQADDHQQVHRVAQDLVQALAQAVHHEHPVVQGQHADQHGDHQRPPEQRAQQGSDRVGQPLGQQRAAGPESQQRVGSRGHGRGSFGGHETQGQQLGREQEADLLAGELPAEVGADRLGDAGRVADAVDVADHLVQQRQDLNDLAVGPPDQRRRPLVTGVLVGAEEFDPVGQPGQLRQLGRPGFR